MQRLKFLAAAVIAAVCAGVCPAVEYTLTTGVHQGSEFTDLSGEVVFKVPAGETTISALNVNGATAVRFVGTSGAKLTLQNCSFVNCGYRSATEVNLATYGEEWDKAFDRSVVLFKDVKATVSGTSFVGCRMLTNRNYGGPIVLVKGDADGSSFANCVWKANDEVYSLVSVKEAIRDFHEFAPSGCTRAGSLVVETADPAAAVSLSGCTFGYNVMTAGWTAGLNVRSGAVTIGGDSVFWGNVASRAYSHHADLDVGYQGSIKVTSAVFAAEDELYLPLNDALVDLSGAKYGDPKFTTRPADVFAALTAAANGKSVLSSETFPIANTNAVVAANGNFYHYFKSDFDRTAINLATTGAGSYAAGNWSPITTGDPGSSEVWAKKDLGIRPAKLEWKLMSTQAKIGTYGGADGVMRSDGRDVQFFRHNFDPDWDDDDNLVAPRSDANTFTVAYPKDTGAGDVKPEGRPLLVSLHSRGGGAPAGGVYSTTGYATATPQTTSSPDSPYEAPDNAYVLSVDCMENHVYDFWWGAMPPATQNWVEKINIENVQNYYYTWTMWNVIKGQLFYGPVGPEGWTRNGALHPAENGIPSVSNLEYLYGTQEKGSACERRVLDTIEWVVRKYKIDRNRIYLAGNSMGGQGTLAIGLKHGEVFASIEGNVPATIWFPAVRMGFVDVNGQPVAKADYQKPEYDPPVCLDWSGSNDAWSRDHDVIYDGMNRFKFNFIGLWGDHGHIQNYSIGRKKNDLINTFDRFAVRRNEAYPAFSNAQSNDPIPWPQKGYKNGDFEGDITVVDGHEVQGGELYIREGSTIAGQVNAWFRWRVVKDTSDEFQMQLWIADEKELPSEQFQRPQSTRVDVTPRRLQNFASASGKVNWTFGDYCHGVAAKDAVLDVWTMEQLPLAVGVPLTLTLTPADAGAETTGTIVDERLVDIPTFAFTKPYSGASQKADVESTDGYTVTGNDGIVNVGETETVTLTLKSGKVWADLTSAPKVFSFSLTQAENAWTVEPSISATSWLMGQTPATLNVGTAKFGTPVSAYPQAGFASMVAGVYANVVSIPETKNYKGLEFPLPFTIYPGGTVDGVNYAYAKTATYWTDNVITFYDTTQTGEITFQTNTSVRILLVGGGGAGGTRGGGGGAGGFIEETTVIPAGTYKVMIGKGGEHAIGAKDSQNYKVSKWPTNGGDTALYQVNGSETNFVFLAHGGGVGSSWTCDSKQFSAPTSGGSGGGGGFKHNGTDGSQIVTGGASVAASPERGFKGGDGIGSYNNGGAGGGGGAGEAGHQASGPGGVLTGGSVTGGRGGDGVMSDITGDEIWYAGGGGGGPDEDTYGSGGSGGKGGGGNGGTFNTNGTDGTDGLGGGGGGGGGGSQNVTRGGDGGDGILILRFYSPTAFDPKADPPTAKAGLVYNGREQSGVEQGEGYTLTGDVVATASGIYTATATLNDGYAWSDNYVEKTRLVVWQIAKAENAWATTAAISKTSWAEGETPGRLTFPVPIYATETMSATMDGKAWDGVALPTEKGPHVVKWSVPAGADYLAAETSVSFTITSEADLPKVVPANTRTAEIGDGDLIVFVGDSITNFGNERNATGYVHIVTNVLKRVKGVNVQFLPAGVNNQQSSDMKRLFEQYGLNKMPSGFTGKKWMTLMCGVNDCNGLQNWGFRSSESYRENVEDTLDFVAANGFSAILMTPSSQNDNLYYKDNAFLTRPPNNVNFPQTLNDLQRQKSNWYEVTHYLPVLQEIAEERGLPLADVHAVLWEMSEKENHRFIPDGDIHPNTFGNFSIARALLRTMGCADADIDTAFAAIIDENAIVIPTEPEYVSGTANNAFYPAMTADDVAGVATFNAVVSTPASLTFVDYVANGGAAYVDTDFELDGNDFVTARVRFNSVDGSAAVWCARNPKNSGNAATSFSCFRSGTEWRYDHLDSPYANGPRFGAIMKDTAYDLWAYGFTFKVDGAEIGDFYALPWEGTTKGKVRLFAGYSATAAVTDVADMRLYGFKVMSADGTAKHDLVPATDGGVAGLYDTVTKKFYKSSNQTALTAGPAKDGKLHYDFPLAAQGLVYNGQPQCGVSASAGYTVTDGVKTGAGNYTATAVLADKVNSTWEDGTTADKSVNWSIAKATNEWTVEPSVSALGWTIGASEPTVVKGVSKFGTAVMKLDGTEWVWGLPKEAGTYTLTCTVEETADWTGLSESFTLTVVAPEREGNVIFAGATTNWIDSELVLSWTDTSTAGLFQLTEQTTVRMFLVGGGGSGGYNDVCGNGGNAGTITKYDEYILSAGSYAVVVGAGGAVPESGASGNAGAESSFIGGGIKILAAGGNGGGAATPANSQASAGGKGAGGSGGGMSFQHGGAGGAAIADDITGVMKAYAGGGGGMGLMSNAGAGGSVSIDGATVTVGGRGYAIQGAGATAGVANTGSGGGGSYGKGGEPGAGADGVVIVRVNVNPCDHVWHSYPELPATCGKDGYTAYEQCEKCEKIKAGGKVVIPATGEHVWGEDDRCEVCGVAKPHIHVWVEPPTLDPAPTCTQDGTNVWHCATEGCFDTSNEVVQALGHDAGIEVPAVAASCTNVGYTAGTRCGRCGDIFSGCEEIPLAPHQYDADGVCTVCQHQGPVPLKETEVTSTGATVTRDGSYMVLVYDDPTQAGTLTLAKTGQARVLVIGGGGAGGQGNGASGGDAGQLIEETEFEIPQGTYSITVGAGGTSKGESGGESKFGELLTAAGGTGGGVTSYGAGNGGKGAGGNGTNRTGTEIGGNGGAAVACDITGEMKAYAGGGAGGVSSDSGTVGTGGGVTIDDEVVRVGGSGGKGAWASGGSGVVGTGSGGGGGTSGAGTGASGIVIVRLKIEAPGPTPEWDIPGTTGGINGFVGEDGVKTVAFDAIELTADGLKVDLSAARIDANGETFGLICKTDLTSDATIVINATLTAEPNATEGVFTVTADLSGYDRLFVVGIGPKSE